MSRTYVSTTPEFLSALPSLRCMVGGMAELHVVSGLVAKYTRILTSLRDKEDEAAALREQLVTLSKAIKLFKPEFEETAIFPKQSYTHNLLFPRGVYYRVVMDILRESNSPLTARELATEALKRQGAPTDRATVDRFRQTLNGALVKYRQAGKLIRHDGDGPQRWELVR